MHENARNMIQPRVELNKKVIKRFLTDIYQGEVSETADDMGLPYSLVYNLVHGRIRSISARDYRVIFGEDPPARAIERVDGRFFRAMARLWLFLNEDATEAGLYSELYPEKVGKKVDYRIFTGQVKTVERRIEKIMEEKFLDQGLDRAEVRRWVDELDHIRQEERVPYEEIKPLLEYLGEQLKVNPSRVLKQFSDRYDSGELKTVSQAVYDRALRLQEKTARAVDSGSAFELEKIRDEIYGKREGMTLYGEVAGELRLLKKYGSRSPKKYLGRDKGHYETGELKRIATWRAKRIHQDFLKLVEKNLELPLFALPASHMMGRLQILTSALVGVVIRRMMEDQDRSYEKSVLAPFAGENEMSGSVRDLVPVDAAPYHLGMSNKAFDLMMARNIDLYRGLVVRSDGKWCLPGRYLEGLSEKHGFLFVKYKYELM